MRVVFFGTPELAVPSLAHISDRHEVTAVVCQPDRPKGRGRKLAPPPVKEWAADHGIPVLQPTKLNDGEFEAWLRGQAPDVCALAAYGRILKQPILDIPAHGFINMHPSLLPKFRGPSPIQSAILLGETETGISIIRLTQDMDAGDILLQDRTEIGPNENAIELSQRLANRGGQLIADAANAIERGDVAYTPQNHSAATYCQMLSKADGIIDWCDSAQAIHNKVRGAQPWPAAQTKFRDEVFKILAGEPHAGDGDAGTIVEVGDSYVDVAAGEGIYRITTWQAPGKRAMPLGDYLRGQRIEAGERFEDM